MRYRIEYYTIKQYSGVIETPSLADFEEELAAMRLDNSVVRIKAYSGDRLVHASTNPNADIRTKSSPVEKGHIN